MIHKTITIKPEHGKWITEYSINLSRFVQKKIDETIDNNGTLQTKQTQITRDNKDENNTDE